jgi:hypothetical protein
MLHGSACLQLFLVFTQARLQVHKLERQLDIGRHAIQAQCCSRSGNAFFVAGELSTSLSCGRQPYLQCGSANHSHERFLESHKCYQSQ